MVVDQMTKVTPPEELSPRIVSRDSPRESVADDRRSAIQARVIRWRDLVLAAWQLAGDEQYTGTLPEGLSSQQFWAKVTRQAKAMHGTVGIVVRGRRWWVWPEHRGTAGKVTARERKFQGLWKSLEAGESATVRGRLTREESRSLRRQGYERDWKLGIVYYRDREATVVWRADAWDAAVAALEGEKAERH